MRLAGRYDAAAYPCRQSLALSSVRRSVDETYRRTPIRSEKASRYNRLMCYSAMVEQDLSSLARRFNARVDYASFEEMMRRRADGEAFNFGKALEANFYQPQSDAEIRIKAHIDRYHEQTVDQLETAVFA